MVIPTTSFSANSEQVLQIASGRSSYTLVTEKLIEGFKKKHPDVKVEVLTIGSLRAMEEARKGAVDVLITYHRSGERQLLKEEVVRSRIEFMFSAYAIFGPPNDELISTNEQSVQNVLRILAKSEAPFVISSTRGGTYIKMTELWESAGIKTNWPWYEVADTTTLGAMRIAAEQGAYTMGDIGTYLLNREELSPSLVPLYQGGYELHKPFSVMSVNYDKVKRKKNPNAEKFVEYITSDEGQSIILDINKEIFDSPVFFPAAHFDPGVIAKRESIRLQQINRNLYIVTGMLIVTGTMLLILFYLFFRARFLQRERLKAEVDKGIAELENRTKSEFLSRMSHELRTPLNAILGFSQILEMQEKNDEKKRNLNDIVKAGKHLHHLINDILELSSLESAGVEIEISEVKVDDVINECVMLCREAFKENDINLKLKGNMQYRINADFLRLKEVILNLMTNAAKYNKKHGDIVVETQEVEDKWLRVSITDSGSGISEEKQKHLFEPFERLGYERTNIEGTGIGLVISKNLVERMSGRIGFNSVKEQGSTFWVEFSLA